MTHLQQFDGLCVVWYPSIDAGGLIEGTPMTSAAKVVRNINYLNGNESVLFIITHMDDCKI